MTPETPTAALARLLCDLLDNQGLYRLLRSLLTHRSVPDELSDVSVARSRYSFEAAEKLIARRLADTAFFQRLLDEFPRRKTDIRQVALTFGVELSDDSLDRHLDRLRAQAFPFQELQRATLVGRRVRRPGGQTIPAHALPEVLPPGLSALVGEPGLGRSSTLYGIVSALQARGARVLCLAGAQPVPGALEEAAASVGHSESVLAQSLDLVVWDDFPATAARSLASLVSASPQLSVLVSCDPGGNAALERAGLRAAPRFVLQPLSTDEAGGLLRARGQDPGILAVWSGQLDSLFPHLAGNPLFLDVAASLAQEQALPHLAHAVAAWLHQMLYAGETSAEEREAWVGVSLACVDTGANRVAPDRLQPRVADGLVRLGLLIPTAPRGWCLRHGYLAAVTAARTRAAEGDYRSVEGATEGSLGEQAAILTPAFADDPLAALERVAPSHGTSWLRTLAALPHQHLEPGALERLFRQHLWLGAHLDQAARIISFVRDVEGALGSSEAIGLLRALVHMGSRDLELLGVLHHTLEQLGRRECAGAAMLMDALIASLPPAPARPACSPVPGAARPVFLARDPVTWEDLAEAFSDAPVAPWREAIHRRPRTTLSWYAAGLVARWWGGVLPTRAEWLAMAGPRPRRCTDAGAGHFPETHARLSEDGPVSVDHPFPRDPGRERCRQMWGGVREWCQDGPPDQDELRYALGGSFRQAPDREIAVSRDARRVDVGVRLAWVNHDKPAADANLGQAR